MEKSESIKMRSHELNVVLWSTRHAKGLWHLRIFEDAKIGAYIESFGRKFQYIA